MEILPDWVREMAWVPVDVVESSYEAAAIEGISKSLEVTFATTTFEWIQLLFLLTASPMQHLGLEAGLLGPHNDCI